MKIERVRGLRLTSYKQPCLKRRLAVRMRARGVHTYDAYGAVLDRVPEEYDLLLDALTINVTRFFRNLETWALVREQVVPELAASRGPAVWSAGCATGEEPYTIAILFAEHAAGAGVRATARVDATDLDPAALDRVRSAEYPAPAIQEVPPELLVKYFSPGPPYRVAGSVTGLVRPLLHDLTREAPPQPPYHLVVCRNVVIYFDRPTQEALFQRFFEALKPGGYLLLGKVETLFGAARARFKLLSARERLFRKPA